MLYKATIALLLASTQAAEEATREARSLLSTRHSLKCDGDYESLKAGDTCVTSWSKLTKGSHQLRATEPAVGHAWAVQQMSNHFSSVKKSQSWFGKHTFPVVLGDNNFYLTDYHHHAIAVQLTDDKEIFESAITLEVVCDLRGAGDSFWDEMQKNNYDFLVDRPEGKPFVLPTVVAPDSLPTTWDLADFGDNMWRSLAGFSSHTSDDSVRCYIKECTYFVDYEWGYVFNYATEVDTTLWPDTKQAADFKQMFESLTYRPDPKSVDIDAWGKAASAVLSLCHSSTLKGFVLPDFFPSKTLAGWSTVPVDANPDCPTSTCPSSSTITV